MARMPLCGSPISQPVASSRFITQVDEALIPILCSIAPQKMPLRAPATVSPPSFLGRNFGTMNRLMPRMPAARRAGAPAPDG